MNLPIPPLSVRAAQTDDVTLARYVDVMLANRWLITSITTLCLALGAAYALLAPRVYQTDILLQIEDSPGSAKSLLGDVSSIFDVKTEATAEIEVLRSRMVLGKAVDSLRLYIIARPRRLPLIGERLAGWRKGLSRPGLFGFGGYAWGAESIQVESFDVPEELEGKRFRLTALGGGRFRLESGYLDAPVEGRVGQLLEFAYDDGKVTLNVSALKGNPGTAFELVRKSRLKTLQELQAKLNIGEKGKQSGIIGASLTDNNRLLAASILNEIGDEYVKQNIKRKAAEAEKSLAFLNGLAPQLKSQLDHAESSYNAMRNSRGTFNLSEEGKTYLQESVTAEAGLLELQQRRTQLIKRYTDSHPAVQAIDQQIAAMSAKNANISQRLKVLPQLEQDTLRLMRDVQVNSDLYVNLLNTSQQLKLVEAGKVGTVRLLDNAAVPVEPIKPNVPVVIAMAGVMGLIFGVGAAFVRFAFHGGVTDPHEIERATGLNVYATVPLSPAQASLSEKTRRDRRGQQLLASHYPSDPSIESLRSVRTAMQFAMLDAGDNRVLVTGPTPGVGKSFVSANLAALMASAGKRVLLVDADLRKGHLNLQFGLECKPGLSDALANNLSSDKVIHREVLPGLDFVSCGTLPPNPTELLMSERAKRMFDDFKDYDLVLIDSPPVLAASDTAVLSGYTGTVLLVTRFEKTSIGEVAESAATLRHANAQMRGVIFNALKPDEYRFGYGSRYGRYRYRDYGYGARSRGE